MRKFGWVRGVGNKPIAQTWDADYPAPDNLIAGTSITLRDTDNRSLDELMHDHPPPKYPEE